MEFRMPSIDQMNPNATHYGILAAMIAKTSGPIAEFGSGHYSTPMLHYMGHAMNRKALSVEVSPDWHKYFRDQFECPGHNFFCTENKLVSRAFPENGTHYNTNWGIVLIDHGPETDRPRCIEMMRNKAKYIVVHDSEPLAVAYNWGNIFDTFKYRFYWDFYGNGTTVVSDVEDIGL